MASVASPRAFFAGAGAELQFVPEEVAMLTFRRLIAVGAMLAVAASGIAFAQTAPGQHPMPVGAHPGMHAGLTSPTMPGQDAFGAIQEIVRLLEADPKTDWSRVNLEALRQHLIDMNQVTLKAEASATPVDGGLAVAVTGSGRTLAAIQRMIPAHAAEINGRNGWSTTTAPLPNGILLMVTASDPKEVRHIRGLGFIGVLTSGAHHQPHHLAMAKGEFAH